MLVSWLSGLPCKAELDVAGARVNVRLALAEPSTQKRPERLVLDAGLLQQMNDLAAKTYVPDSDASRAGGAGAGLMELD